MTYGIPWAPRMDIWYYGNSYRNTLPEKFKDLKLRQIIKKMGVTYNKILPDFADGYTLKAVEDRLLGVFASKDVPYEIILDDSIKRVVNEKNDGLVEINYQTPKGHLKGVFKMDEELKRGGSTLPPIKEYLIKTDEDYSKAADIFSSIKIIPKPENYQRLLEKIGDDGYPPLYGHLAASPMQAILRDLMNPTTFFIEYKLNFKKLLELCDVLEKFLLDIIYSILQSFPKFPVIVWGGNYDSMLTFPPFFKEHILPFLNKVCEIIHEREGLVISHCDGENAQLLNLYRESGIDILQAVNLKPMVKNDYREIRESLRPDQVIMGGIPSIILLDSLFSDSQFMDFLKEFRKSYRKGEPLLLEVSDNVPPDANLNRLEIIGEFVETL
ncbi:hypothetical protein KAW50_07595 [candidate division WOR-3 bacterium]|nr:hypothetical protein [candidate division WOR-3 bacterium]